MAARTSLEEQRRRRRKRLAKGLLLGGAAVGLPALANALIARRTGRLAAPSWGRTRTYAWRLGEVSFQRLGDGEPLLLIHSFGPGHSAEEWRPAGERLAQTHNVHVVDLLGWGRSDKPRITYDAELYIDLLGDFLEDVIRRPCTLVAAGLPAAYAVQLAADQPELVRDLALVVPSGIDLHGDEPDLKDALLHRMLRLPILGTSALNLLTSRSALAQHLKRDSFHGPEQVDAARVDQQYKASHQQGAHAPLAAYLSGYLNHRVDEALSRLSCPLWLAWGRQAVSPPVESADLWVRKVPEAAIEVMEDCGNLPHLEAPARFAAALGRFLGG